MQRIFTSFFKEASSKELATFTDGFLAAMAVYNQRCPVEDNPNDKETQTWVAGKVLEQQAEYFNEMSRAELMISTFYKEKPEALGEQYVGGLYHSESPVPMVVAQLITGEACLSPHYRYDINKYDVMSMLMDCERVDCTGNEIDLDGELVKPEKHRAWPRTLFHHRETGTEILREQYQALPRDQQVQYDEVKYVSARRPDDSLERICEDDYRIVELIDRLITIGDPINKKLLEQEELIEGLRKRFRYDLVEAIMKVKASTEPES